MWKPPKTILVPTDFSETAALALDYAVGLAASLDAQICLLHVVSPPMLTGDLGLEMTGPMLASLAEDGERGVALLVAERATRAKFAPPVSCTGDPRAEIAAAVSRLGADLIVMGTHGRGGLARVVMGSVAESLARSATCPVLLVRLPPR